MARVGWQEVTKRFAHIDAHFIKCNIGLPQNDGFFTVELYPWWEHPLFLVARAEGANWRIANGHEGYAQVTVYPKNVHTFRLSRREEVTDWDFTQEHPTLWQYEMHGEITCNQPLTVEQWIEVIALVIKEFTGYYSDADIAQDSILKVRQWGHTGSFSLGSYPRSLFTALCRALDTQGIHYFASSQPLPTQVPVMFLIDNDDFIIADDFEIDVPEFIHKPEWFQPG